jgi:hypothetical protein
MCFVKVHISPDFAGIGIIEMLFHTGIIIFVGSGENTSYPPTRLTLYEAGRNKEHAEITYQSKILKVKLNLSK